MILKSLRKFRRKQIMSSIRENMFFFGHDLSGMSDDEIEEGVVRAGKVFSQTGFSCKQVASGLSVMACAGNASNWKEHNARKIEECRDRF